MEIILFFIIVIFIVRLIIFLLSKYSPETHHRKRQAVSNYTYRNIFKNHKNSENNIRLSATKQDRYFPKIHNSRRQVEAKYNDKNNISSLIEFDRNLDKRMVLSRTNIPAQEISIYNTILNARNNHKNIFLHYIDSKGVETHREVKPELFGIYKGMNYLIGYCYLDKDKRTFRFDRMISVNVKQ